MTDYFALLQQPRRPWLDDGKLKEQYHALVLAAHPDTAHHEDDSGAAAILNEGYRVLQNPKLRIEHLLALEDNAPKTGQTRVPAPIDDLFWQAGTLVKEIETALAEASATTSGLARALLRRRITEINQRTTGMLEKLDALSRDGLEKLRAIDAVWDTTHDLAALHEVHNLLSYTMRWTEQFREKLFQLQQV
jgi:DnaJ-domain-containing protein 1